ncbi:MAG: hypothetical protein JJT96_17110 [Opitutales bacterium]|nr:hypothetical protein [Opitutales bacterium]
MFNIRTTPFSTRGSYLTLTHPILRKLGDGTSLPEGLYLCTVRGEADVRDVLRIEAITDAPVSERLTPVSLHLETEAGAGIDIVFENPAVLRFRCRGVGLRLVRAEWRPFDCIIERNPGVWLLSSYLNKSRFALRQLSGEVWVDAPWERVRCPSLRIEVRPSGAAGMAELSLEEFQGSWSPESSTAVGAGFDSCRAARSADWEAWLAKQICAPEPLREARALAAYINQSCIVGPSGHFTREALLMSKYKMTNYWTWDNCFNVLGLASSDPELAWDQMMLAFAHQSPQGQLPASFNNAELHWMDAKPPVHGWALGKLMRETDWVGMGKLQQVYEPLAAFTEWWFRFRDHDGDGLPAAFHGNDTGWDNASVFDERPPVTTPDLSAYLVIQMEVLGTVAELLGKERAAREWERRGKALLERMIERLWDPEKGQFVSLKGDGRTPAPGDSLINFMPLVLGRRLPPDVLEPLVQSLMRPGRFLTDWGLATESLRSPFYSPEGYWRGPIWAPPTLLVFSGLQEGGYAAEAETIRHRFLNLCARAGFPENFHATEGRALRDPTYTWTTSTFFHLLAR